MSINYCHFTVQRFSPNKRVHIEMFTHCPFDLVKKKKVQSIKVSKNKLSNQFVQPTKSDHTLKDIRRINMKTTSAGIEEQFAHLVPRGIPPVLISFIVCIETI